MKKKIGILNLNISNLGSICNIIEKHGYKAIPFGVNENLNRFYKIIIPGVGSYPSAMNKIKNSNLIEKLNIFLKQKKILGICLGMQIFYKKSYELKPSKGIGLIEEEIIKLKFLKNLPNIGYCKVNIVKKDKLFKNIDNNSYFYFMHSYGVLNRKNNLNTSVVKYKNKNFVSSVNYNNFYGVQFHPEKSGKIGFKLIKNFLNE